MKPNEAIKPSDDFEAVRIIASALEKFDSKDQERILRWAREKVGLVVGGYNIQESTTTPIPLSRKAEIQTLASPATRDIKSFVELKKPASDTQFVAVVAYYYQFEAPAEQRKPDISADDLKEACRYVNWPRPAIPRITLNNAKLAGVVDRSEHGKYRISSVGENLVAMTLPHTSGSSEIANVSRRRSSKKITKSHKPKKK